MKDMIVQLLAWSVIGAVCLGSVYYAINKIMPFDPDRAAVEVVTR